MEKKFLSPFKVGLVVLAGIIVSVVMITRVGSRWGDNEETFTVFAYFDDVTGLAERSQVRMAGIQVGEVEQIDLVEGRARVRIRIASKINLYEGLPLPSGHYRDGATVAKKLSGLLGDYYIEITSGLQGETLGDGDEIKNVIQGGGPDAIMAELEKITRDVSRVTSALADVFGGEDGRQRIDAIFRDVEDISRTLRAVTLENADRLDRIIDNVEKLSADARVILRASGDDVDLILKDIRLASRELRQMMDNVGGRVERSFEHVDRTMITAHQALEKLDRSLAHLESVSAGLATGEGSIGRILTDDTMAREAESLLQETRVLVSSATSAIDSAGGLLGSIDQLETIVDLRNDYMVGFNAFKNVLSLKLRPRPTKWYIVELILDPRGKTTTTRRVRDATGSEPTYEEITETTGDLKFSFQFAGRWNFIAGRFGLIESTGGIGTNLYLFDDNIEIVADLFDFGYSPYPRLRTYGLIYFDLFLPWSWAENIYVSAGIDDPFNMSSFDYFGGIGFSFNDRDLKGLLTVAPVPSF